MNRDGSVFYVSPHGRDAWSGTMPDPTLDGSDGPFAGIGRAQLAARGVDRAAAGAIRIVVRGGTYYLEQPICLGGEDSGTVDCPVVYEAWPGEQPVFSAGVLVRGWREISRRGRRTWVAPAPGHVFHNLWVNDERRFRPRYPRDSLLRTVGPSLGSFYEGAVEFRVDPKDLRAFGRQEDVELVYFAVWTESRMPIASIDREKGTIHTGLRSAMNASGLNFSSTYYYDNVLEELDSAGQWCLDGAEAVLTYLPYDGETLENTRIVAPRLVHALKVAGTRDRPVSNVRFVGLTFRHTEWWRTDQTRIFRWDIRKLEPVAERDIGVVTLADDKAADHQAAISCEAALDLAWARECSIVDCTVSSTGSYGISLGSGCFGNTIRGCLVSGQGGGGVKIGTQQVEALDAAAFNTVMDCEIRDCAEVFHSAVGVWIGQSAHNRIAHNSIHDVSYTGISVGWTWGYGPSGAYCNLIEHNEIYNIAVNGWMHDLGGIYMLGVSPGTIVRNNVIRNVGNDNNVVGIYTDEGSSFIRWENNIVDHAVSAYLHHYGRNNTIVNNIFAHYQTGLVVGKDESPDVSLLVERNIFMSDHGEVLRDWQGRDGCVYRSNIYWCARGVLFNGKDHEAWRVLSRDAGSVVADPLFADPEAGDYSLDPGSPAIRAGFVPFDLRGVGPRTAPGAHAYARRGLSTPRASASSGTDSR